MTEWETIKQHTKINRSKFLTILDFCLKNNNFFKFNENLYQQTFGMPMGNPLSPTIPDIILDELLDYTIDILRSKNIHVKFIVKYVDDIFAIINQKDAKIILQTPNNYHNNSQYNQNKTIA